MNTTISTFRMMQIAARLGVLYNEKAIAGLAQWQHEADNLARQIAITPQDGWPGKNAEQREIEQKRAFLADEMLQKIGVQLAADRELLASMDAEIQTLTDERRAIEWSIRAGLVEALTGQAIQAQSDAPIDLGAFDDVMQGKADDGLAQFLEEEQAWAEHGPAPVYEESTERLARAEPGDNGYHLVDDLPF